jgi:hypothetical protein
MEINRQPKFVIALLSEENVISIPPYLLLVPIPKFLPLSTGIGWYLCNTSFEKSVIKPTAFMFLYFLRLAT